MGKMLMMNSIDIVMYNIWQQIEVLQIQSTRNSHTLKLSLLVSFHFFVFVVVLSNSDVSLLNSCLVGKTCLIAVALTCPLMIFLIFVQDLDLILFLSYRFHQDQCTIQWIILGRTESIQNLCVACISESEFLHRSNPHCWQTVLRPPVGLNSSRHHCHLMYHSQCWNHLE